MGWFEDHDDDGDDIADEFLGNNRWYRDDGPASSSRSRETPRVDRPEAEWDETKWRKSNFGTDETIAKGRAKNTYLLTDNDLLPLEYRKEINFMGFRTMKGYRKREVERLSWQKHGGPSGLKAAKAEKKANARVPRARKPKAASGNGVGKAPLAKKGVRTMPY